MTYSQAVQGGLTNFQTALGVLVVVVVGLLTVAVRNTWDLLVTVADKPDAPAPR